MSAPTASAPSGGGSAERPGERPGERPVQGAESDPETGQSADGAPEPAPKRPLYPRLLRLRNISPNGWQRALLGEGALAVAVVLVLADAASAWTLLVLPLGVAAVVKAHDVLAGLLPAESEGPVVEPERLSPADGARHHDLAALEELVGRGLQLDPDQELLHHLRAPDEASARAVANVVDGRGFTTRLDGSDGGEPVVVCRAGSLLTPAAVRESRKLFDDLSERYGVEYGGWEIAPGARE